MIIYSFLDIFYKKGLVDDVIFIIESLLLYVTFLQGVFFVLFWIREWMVC